MVDQRRHRHGVARQRRHRLANRLPAADSRRSVAARLFSFLLAHQHSRFLAPLRGRLARCSVRPPAKVAAQLFSIQQDRRLDVAPDQRHPCRARAHGFWFAGDRRRGGGDSFQLDSDDHHRSLADPVVDDGDAVYSRCRALLRTAYFPLVARHPGSTERDERLHAGKLLRHPRRPSLRPGGKPDSRLRSDQLRVPQARPCGWRRCGGFSGR